MNKYLVVIEHEGSSLGSYCPDLPGVGVIGDTCEEVEQLAREAVTFHIDALREAGEPIPSVSAVASVRVDGRVA